VIKRSAALAILGALLCLFCPVRASEVAVTVAEEQVASPDETVKNVLEGLADNRPQVLWHALPASYRADVEGLIRQAATKMDPELWDRTFVVLGKASRVMREKGSFILDHPALVAKIEDRAEAERGWNAVVSLVEIVLNSELSDLEKMKTLEVEKFLSSTGVAVMKQFGAMSALTGSDTYAGSLERLRQTKVVVVSLEGDAATVRIETPGKSPVERHLVRVENKWLPDKLAGSWSEKMAKARASLDAYSPEMMAQTKQQTLMQLAMAEGLLDALLQAQTAEQFHAALQPAMGMIVGAAMARANAAEAPAEAAPEIEEPPASSQESSDTGASM
jgi:hypothetical protein